MKKNYFLFIVLSVAFLFLAAFTYQSGFDLLNDVQNTSPTNMSNEPLNRDDGKLPVGYTFYSYDIAEVSTTTCQTDNECILPASYAIRSSCPYQSICLKNSCTIVCPKYK